MGCDEKRDKTDYELDQQGRDSAFRVLLERFSKVPAGEFRLDELLIIHKLHVTSTFHATFPPKITADELALLRSAERRIFGKKGREGNPYSLGNAGTRR